MDRSGFKMSDFVIPKDEKAVHPSYDAEKFQQKSALFAEVVDQKHGIQVLGHGHGFVEAIAKSHGYHMVTVDVANAETAGFAMKKEYHAKVLDASKAIGEAHEWLYGRKEPSTGAWREGEFVKALKEVVYGETSKKEGIKIVLLKMYSIDYTVFDELTSLIDDNKTLITRDGE